MLKIVKEQNYNATIKKAFLLFCLIVSVSCTENKDHLVGIWQDSPEIASGWSDTYQIFLDGTFKFNYNQMICDKRTISLIGNWKKQPKSGTIVFTIKQKVIVEGGKLIPSVGSCPSDSDLEGGKIKTINLNKFETKNLKIRKIQIDKDHKNLETIKLNGKPFWRFDKNPNNFK